MGKYNNSQPRLKKDKSCIKILRNQKEYKAIDSIELKEDIKTELFNEFKKINFNPYTEFNTIYQLIDKNSLTKLLPNFFAQSKYISVNIIQNLPIDKNLVETPLTDKTPIEKEKTSELSLLLLSVALKAFPYVNEDEKSNTVIQNVIPIPNKELELSGLGSSRTFNWHTENIHEENPADYLLLLALRGDKNAFTSFMLVEDIVSGLSNSTLQALLSTNFLMKTGPSYSKEKSIIRPILSKDENSNFKIYYNSDINRCVPLSDDGEELYFLFQNYLESSVPCYSVSLRQGEAVIINNKEALHKRDGFEVSTTIEERRWLQRIYLKKPNSQDDEIEDFSSEWNISDNLHELGICNSTEHY